MGQVDVLHTTCDTSLAVVYKKSSELFSTCVARKPLREVEQFSYFTQFLDDSLGGVDE